MSSKCCKKRQLIDSRIFHQPHVYTKYKKLLNVENISFPMKNKNIDLFLRNNPKLDISIRLFDSIVVSKNDMKIYEPKVIEKGRKIINLLFHKSYKNKKSCYHYFWIKISIILKKQLKGGLFVMCAMRNLVPVSH